MAMVVMASLVAGACTRDDDARANGRDDGAALAAIPRRAPQGPPYTTTTLEAIGQLRGFVQLDGPPPSDTVIQPTSDHPVCGTGFTRRGVQRRGAQAAGVVVWIEGIRSGKPLPLERRFEITNERCLLAPEVQTAVAGGTLNVRSLDRVEHRTRITHRDRGEVLATIRQTDEGQVVPNEHVLTRPGILHLSCDLHGWTHGWIAVFDHPYAAMSGDDGGFAMDSVPPGRYLIRGWHPRLGAIEDSVTVTANQATQVVLRAVAR